MMITSKFYLIEILIDLSFFWLSVQNKYMSIRRISFLERKKNYLYFVLSIHRLNYIKLVWNIKVSTCY